MQAVVFNFSRSSINQVREAIALKIGYLLCNNSITAGDIGYYIVADHFLADLPLAGKINMLLTYYASDPDSMEYLHNAQKLLKQAAKIKHKDRQQIIAQKMCEKEIIANWERVLNGHLEHVKETGFHQLQQLRKEDAIVFYPMKTNSEDLQEQYITASDLLRLNLFDIDETFEEDSTQLFFLSVDFDKEAQPAPVIYSVTDEEAKDITNSYLQKVFTLPYINDLSAAELQMLRRQFSKDDVDFLIQADGWINACYNGENTGERMDLFIQYLMPAAALLQQQIESNELLRWQHKKYDPSMRLEVWMGEVPVWLLWQYYKDYKVIEENTWSKLEEAKESEEFKGQRWPVMMLKMSDPETTEEEDQEIKSTKKYLRID